MLDLYISLFTELDVNLLPCAILRHYIVIQDSGSQPEMLAWMKYLHTKLSSNSTGYNTKLFIARLIINAEEVG